MHAGTRIWEIPKFLLVIGIRLKKEDPKTHGGREDKKSKDKVKAQKLGLQTHDCTWDKIVSNGHR